MQIRRLLLFWFPLAALIGLCVYFWLPRGIRYLEVNRLSGPVLQACEAGQQRLVLADVARFDWDEVAILGPYVSRPWAARVLGYPWDDYLDYRELWGGDTYAALLFLKEGQIVRTQLHWRTHGEFPYPLRRISRDQAVFDIQRGDKGCAFAQLTLAGSR